MSSTGCYKIPANGSRDINRLLTAVVCDDLSLRSIGSNDRYRAELNDRRIRSHVRSSVDYDYSYTGSCCASSVRVFMQLARLPRALAISQLFRTNSKLRGFSLSELQILHTPPVYFKTNASR